MKGLSIMQDIDVKKNSYGLHMDAANMALTVNDLLSAYDNLMICGDIASEISTLSMDNDESVKYAQLSESCYKQAKDHLSKLHLSSEEEKKLRKRKVPKGFDKYVGEDKLKDYLSKTVIEPWNKHELYKRSMSGIMIYGPEGVSKSVFVSSLIHELHATPYFINPLKNFSPYSENTKNNIKKLFEMAEKKDNVVFFITEPLCFFPALQDKESKDTCKIFIKLLKKEMKRVKKLKLNILCVCATSTPDKLNKKIFNKGMFDDLLRIHHPNRTTRKQLMEERLKGIEFENQGVIDELVKHTHGFISKEISRLCRRIVNTAQIYGKDGKYAIITKDMMTHIWDDLKPMDDEQFTAHVSDFEKSLPACVSILNDNEE